jgi:hypothetical protein
MIFHKCEFFEIFLLYYILINKLKLGATLAHLGATDEAM